MKLLPLFFLVLSSAIQACEIPADTWDMPRSARTFLSMQSISACINPFLADRETRLSIVHGKDAESLLHQEELRAWLISLGIEPARIDEKIAAGGKDISLELVK